ncbi:MAG: hypothetical protein GY854_15315 [Deltaproteobacteria bacterium]|nr:hypothetical protein [Deltaproteobacteria bacterium]
MEHHDEKKTRAASRAERRKGKRRDDTPSFIRNVQSRAQTLNPQRQSLESIPVLTMPKSVKLWRAIRWPLAVLIVVLVLGTVGLVTKDILVARNVENTISDSQSAEVFGAVDGLLAASQTLANLAERHPDRTNAQAAWAWQAVLQAKLLGPEAPLTQKAGAALELAGNDGSALELAAQAGLMHLEGKNEEALEMVTQSIAKHPTEPRLKLVRAWALGGLGKKKEAQEAFQQEMNSNAGYTPIIIAGIAFQFENGNRLEALTQAQKLLSISHGHLYGYLMTIALALPLWGTADPPVDRVATLLKDIKNLKSAIEKAPPKLAVFGNYLKGRVNLLAGYPKEAIAAFDKILDRTTDSEVFAWYAVALQDQKGPGAALEFLEAHPDIEGPATFEIRARSLLTYHQVNAAAEVMEKLKGSGAHPDRVKALRWLLAVRSGDTQTALALMPDKIGKKDQLLAVDLYFALKEMGNSTGITKLAESMDGELSRCSEAIRAWHKNDFKRAMRALEVNEEDSPGCLDAVALRLLRGHAAPTKLKTISERLKREYALDLSTRVGRALASWSVDGHAATVKQVDKAWKSRPEGVPIRCAIGRAYLELNMPNKTLEVLDGVEAPEGLAIRILAARKAKKKGLAAKLVKTAIAQNKNTSHPALAYFYLQSRFDAGKISDVFEEIVPLLKNAGQWTSEIAEIGAMTLNFKGDRTVADRLLSQTVKQALASGGLDEAWETRIAAVRLNLRRGGKFMYRSLSLIKVFKEEGVKDPRVSYSFAMANIKDGNDRVGLRSLREALSLDPTYRQAYKQLISMSKLDDETAAVMKRMRPDLSR